MAALTPDELSGLLQRLRDLTDWWVIAAVEAGGIEALDPVTIQRLVDRGILTPDTQAAIESGDAPDLVGDAFVTGLLFQRLAEEGEDAADWDAKRWHEAIDKRPIALSTEERAILDASRRDVGLYIQGLGNKLADQVGNLVIEVLAEGVNQNDVAVGDVMSYELVTANEDDDLFDTLKHMRTRGIRRLPVVDSTGGLVGIVTVDDLLDLLAEQVSDLARIVQREQRRERERRR